MSLLLLPDCQQELKRKMEMTCCHQRAWYHFLKLYRSGLLLDKQCKLNVAMQGFHFHRFATEKIPELMSNQLKKYLLYQLVQDFFSCKPVKMKTLLCGVQLT